VPGQMVGARWIPEDGSELWSDLRKTEGGKVKKRSPAGWIAEAFDTYEKSRGRSRSYGPVTLFCGVAA